LASNEGGSSIHYICGGVELLDTIEFLWQQLNRHHGKISPHFSGEFCANNFAGRKARLLAKYAEGHLRVDLALKHSRTVGYLVSGVTADGIGEIESIFVTVECRGQALGDELMQRALQWLDQQQAHTKLVAVAVGNERSYSFYARFGFYPRLVILKQKEPMENLSRSG